MTLQSVLVLLAVALSVGVFSLRLGRRLRLLARGRPAGRFDRWGERLASVARFVLGQARLVRFPAAGVAHVALFWGFVLLAPTILQAMLEGIFPGFVLPFLGTFGPLLLVQDVAALVVIGAVGYGLYLRLVVRPERYEGSHHGEAVLVLAFILAIMVGLLGMTGARHQLDEATVSAGWQPVSALVGALFAGASPGTLHVLHDIFYWLHLGVVLVFLPLLPGGKHFHVVTSLANVLLRRLDPPGRLAPVAEGAGAEGVGRIEDFTWRQMLDWYGCTQCGRCQDVCPAHASGLEISPKSLIMSLRLHLEATGLAPTAVSPGTAVSSGSSGPEVGPEAAAPERLVGDVLPDRMLWSCATCLACDVECPLFVEHVQPVVDMRRHLLSEQRSDEELARSLVALRRYGNSFGKSERQRAAWTKPLDPRPTDIRKQGARTLWFVGDYASYSPALVETTRATARVLRRLGIDYGILYDAERNAGNDVRRVGEEGLFELLRLKNRKALDKCQYDEIVTTDPHSYNALRNEYGSNGDALPVVHSSELFDRALRARAESLRKLGYRVTYHDPCYLGRYNGIYDAPRRVIEATGCDLVEMPGHRDRALCCGAGGGRIWMDEGKVDERPSERRVREAAALAGVSRIVVACPKDVTMFRDAIKTTGLEGRLEVVELAELVEEALGDEDPVGAASSSAENVSEPRAEAKP